MSIEIERKFLVNPPLPFSLKQYPSKQFSQGYLCTDPVIRIRREEDEYWLTYKGRGLLCRQEENLPLTKDSFEHLLKKIDGRLIQKRRYQIPCGKSLTAELDIFQGSLSPLMMVEVEFPSKEEANRFIPPFWFGTEVTFSTEYHNSILSKY